MTQLWKKILFKPKKVVRLLQKNQGVLYLIKKVELKKNENIVRIGKRTYNVDLENPTYISYNTRYYDLDLELGSTYTFTEKFNAITAEEADMLISRGFIKELAQGAMPNKKELLMYLLGGVVMGALLGFVIMNVIMTNKIETLYQEMLDSDLLTPFTIMKQLWSVFKWA